ncbi:hypothetical protein Hbl1158_13880 [Halobaculum sp. CBA1158]|uniref:hypothetical protein n=1 Tax=Halobaculum sp. CBA1158 TaxID=2904243 RepID=UPI001F24F66D|nr:hypothetical protein [Halobaculum sp. CBA1158]UIO99598.1 hypothetical protein Hbl1158_13880 [Halobaculum sp. CBA1158]
MPSESADRSELDHRSDADEEPLTEADVERIVRRVVREELDARDRRSGSVWTLLAGAFVGVLVLLPVSGIALSALADAGVPLPILAVASLLAAAALVAYGWRLPPFR